MRNEDVLLRVKKQRNILHEIRKRKTKWIGHILRKNCLLQRVTEGKIQGGIELTGRQGRRCRKLLDDLKERRELSYMKYVNGRRNGLVTFCVETAFYNGLLKERYKGR
jgi:hypothetical protein